MYAVRRWDEEVIKWLAVAMCLAMVGLMVMPAINVGDAGVALMVYGATQHDGASFLGGLTFCWWSTVFRYKCCCNTGY